MKLASTISVPALIGIIAALPDALAGVALIVAAASISASYIHVVAVRTLIRESRKPLLAARRSPSILKHARKAKSRLTSAIAHEPAKASI